ncbi:MAG: squalene/phytoene synthase family protein [Pseudomonadota bacterium]
MIDLDPGLVKHLRLADPDRHRSGLSAPPEKRAALLTLYAVNLEIARTPWRASEPQIAQIRLQWWIDAIEEIYSGEAPRRHELVLPVATLLERARPPKEWVIEMIEARGRDIDPSPMLGRPEFDRYIFGTSGSLMRLACQVLMDGELSTETSETVSAVGYAHGVANMLRAIPALAALDRVMIPPVTGEAINRSVVLQKKTPPELQRAVAKIAHDAETGLKKARKAEIDRRLHPALLSAWRTPPILRAAQRRDLDAFKHFTDESPFRRDLTFAMARLRGW